MYQNLYPVLDNLSVAVSCFELLSATLNAAEDRLVKTVNVIDGSLLGGIRRLARVHVNLTTVVSAQCEFLWTTVEKRTK